MKRSTTKWRGLVILAGVLIVAGLLLGACGSSSDDGGGTTTARARPSRAAPTTTRSAANPVSIEPLNAQESEGMQVAHQVFEGLVKYVMNDKGEMVAVPNIAERWETTDSQTWTFTSRRASCSRRP